MLIKKFQSHYNLLISCILLSWLSLLSRPFFLSKFQNSDTHVWSSMLIILLVHIYVQTVQRHGVCIAAYDLQLLVCRLDKLLSWFSTQASVVNFRYYLFCLCNVRRQYLLPGILGIYCFLTGVPSLPAIALPKGRICSLVNQVYTSFPLMSLPPFGLHWPNVG